MISFVVPATDQKLFEEIGDDYRLRNRKELSDWLFMQYGLPGDADDRDDWRYYLDTHMTLDMESYHSNVLSSRKMSIPRPKIIPLSRTFVFNHEKDAMLFKLTWL